MLILNDIHIGVQRKAGTTPASQEALRTYLFNSFREVLSTSQENHLCILGDLFDTFDVSSRDWIETYHALARWILTGKRLTLVAGNHDHSPKALRVSAFQMLCDVLQHGYEAVQVVAIDQWTEVEPGVIALAHCSNQDIFDLRLKEVWGCGKQYTHLLLHANYDNNFAAQSDHSLNVDEKTADNFTSAGVTVVFAHEHQARTAAGGRIMVLGNQWPTSIADCLNNDVKYAHVLKDGALTKNEATWKRDAEAAFEVVPWRMLNDYPVDGGAGFIRVEGDATANEAGEVISAIAKFRSKSGAFVVSNMVKIEGMVQAEELPEQFEATKAFDVMTFIQNNLDAKEFEVVQTKLMKEPR